MDVLVTERRPGAAARVKAALTAGGHRVHSCVAPGSDEAIACAALNGAQCPLDGKVHVAVDVWDEGGESISGGEIGAICAVRRGIPLVVVSEQPSTPLEPWAERVVPEKYAESACAQARALPLRTMHLAAERAVAQVLRERGDGVHDVTLVVDNAVVDVLVGLSDLPSGRLAATLSAAVRQALARYHVGEQVHVSYTLARRTA